MATNIKIRKKAMLNLPRNNEGQDEEEIIRMLNQARADTAKRIFKALEAIKDEYGNPLLDFLYYKGESYAKLKKKFKVD